MDGTMRFIAAIAGTLVSILPLIFFWVGSSTFIRPAEQLLARVMVGLSGGLLIASLALFFTPVVQRVQAFLLAATIVAVAAILFLSRRG
jgi:hypothetical protein